MATTDPVTPEEIEPVGVVESQLPAPTTEAPPPPADEYKAPEVAPVATQVDSSQETVESRLNDMTAQGSTYTDLAKKDAQRSANSRGLINSTMAGAAGTEAAIRAALPIAQQDAATYTDTRVLNQNTENEFLKNRQSANLNMETAAQTSQLAQIESTLNSDLQLQFEKTMQDERFSDEAKMSAVDSMDNIIRDSQSQIVEVGLSDRSAAQQESAIKMIEVNRDAELAVYQDLLESFNDWEWSTDFTPKPSAGATSSYIAPETAPTEPPPGSYGTDGDPNYKTRGTLSQDGGWEWDGRQWVAL